MVVGVVVVSGEGDVVVSEVVVVVVDVVVNVVEVVVIVVVVVVVEVARSERCRGRRSYGSRGCSRR